MEIARPKRLGQILFYVALFSFILIACRLFAVFVAEQASGTFNWAAARERYVADTYGEEWVTTYRFSKQGFINQFNNLNPIQFADYFGDIQVNNEIVATKTKVVIEAYKAAMIESEKFDDFTYEGIGIVFLNLEYSVEEAAYFADLFEEFFRPQINLRIIRDDANKWQTYK